MAYGNPWTTYNDLGEWLKQIWTTLSGGGGTVTPGTAASTSQLVGGVYTAAPTAATTTQQRALQQGEYGPARVEICNPATGLPLSVTDPSQVYSSNSYARITTNTTTTVKSGAGTLASITIGTSGASANTITIYDSLAGSGTVISLVNGTMSPGTLAYNVAFGTGLTIVTATGTCADITVGYR